MSHDLTSDLGLRKISSERNSSLSFYDNGKKMTPHGVQRGFSSGYWGRIFAGWGGGADWHSVTLGKEGNNKVRVLIYLE